MFLEKIVLYNAADKQKTEIGLVNVSPILSYVMVDGFLSFQIYFSTLIFFTKDKINFIYFESIPFTSGYTIFVRICCNCLDPSSFVSRFLISCSNWSI